MQRERGEVTESERGRARRPVARRVTGSAGGRAGAVAGTTTATAGGAKDAEAGQERARGLRGKCSAGRRSSKGREGHGASKGRGG